MSSPRNHSQERPAAAGAASPVPPLDASRRGRNLTQQLVASLSERIQWRELRPGDKLPTEAQIMRAYGVSRTVVREAISRIAAGGLVETRHGIGTFVLDARANGPLHLSIPDLATIRDVLEILELRISLETESAALAATRRSVTQLAAMRRALDDFAACVDREEDAVKPDYEFHRQVALASGNRYLGDLMGELGPAHIPRTRINTAQFQREEGPDYLRRVNREHEDIYAAINRSDPEAARAAMRTHLGNSRERLKRAHEGRSATMTQSEEPRRA
jgi:DNA-binding FadR family transcriptional regulator